MPDFQLLFYGDCSVDLLKIPGDFQYRYLVSPKYPDLLDHINSELQDNHGFIDFMDGDLFDQEHAKYKRCMKQYLVDKSPQVLSIPILMS